MKDEQPKPETIGAFAPNGAENTLVCNWPQVLRVTMYDGSTISVPLAGGTIIKISSYGAIKSVDMFPITPEGPKSI